MNFDAAVFAALVEPLQVRVSRTAPDGRGGTLPQEPMGLPNDGTGFTHAMADIQAFERVARDQWGGGLYTVAITDAHGRSVSYEFMIPQPPRADPAKQAATAAATPAWAQPAAPQPAAGWGQPGAQPWGAPAAPIWGQPSAPTWGQPAPMWGQPPAQPQVPWWGAAQPPQDAPPPGVNPQWWAQQSHHVRQQLLQSMGMGPWWAGSAPSFMPPPVAAATPGGADPGITAELKALQLQNQQLRESQLLKQSSEAAERQASSFKDVLTAMQAQSAEQARRMETMLAQMMDGRRNQPSEELTELRRRLDEQAHRQAADTMRMELERVRAEQSAARDALQREIAAAKESGNQQLFAQLMQAQQTQGQQHMTTLIQVMGEASKKQPTMAEQLALFKSITTSERDPTVAALMEIALDNVRNPGQAPSTGAMVVEAVGRLGETAQRIASAVVAGKVDENTNRAKIEAQARQSMARQAQALSGATAPPTGTTPAPSPSAAPAAAQPAAAPPPVDGDPSLSAAENERRALIGYFGPLVQYLGQIRGAANAGADVNALARAIATNLVHNIVDWNVQAERVPVFKDLLPEAVGGTGNLGEAVRRALPDASATYRNELVEALRIAIPEELQNAREAQQGEEGGEEGEEGGGEGAAEGEGAPPA